MYEGKTKENQKNQNAKHTHVAKKKTEERQPKQGKSKGKRSSSQKGLFQKRTDNVSRRSKQGKIKSYPKKSSSLYV